MTYRFACTRLKRLVDYLFDFYFLFCRISHSDVENLLHPTDEKRQKYGMASSRILMLLSEKITGRVDRYFAVGELPEEQGHLQ